MNMIIYKHMCGSRLSSLLCLFHDHDLFLSFTLNFGSLQFVDIQMVELAHCSLAYSSSPAESYPVLVQIFDY